MTKPMTDSARTRRVQADVAEIWAVLGDFGAISRWAPTVDHSCLMTDQLEGVGTVRRIQTGRATIVERVTEWEPNSTLAYALEDLPSILGSVENRWTLEPADSGVLVTLTSKVDAGSRPPQRIIARTVGRRLATAAGQMLDGLDRYLHERESARP